MSRRNLSVFPKPVAAPLVEEKAAEEEKNASSSHDAQVVGAGTVSSMWKTVTARINGNPAAEESAAEKKETDEHSTPFQPLDHSSQGKRHSMREKSATVAKKGSKVAHHVW